MNFIPKLNKNVTRFQLNNNMNTTYPITPCIFCAEKHYSTAMALANEVSYTSSNRQFIIGELVAAQLHVYKKYPELSQKIRQIRHLVQYRKENEIDWIPICLEINEIITKKLQETN